MCTVTTLKRKRSSPGGNITDNIATTLPPRKVVRVMSALPARLLKQSNNTSSPQECLDSIVRTQGIASEPQSYNAVPEYFFEETRDEDINSYGFDVVRAVRDSDIEQLRKFHESGRTLKCSNQFGESILHLACRKGLVPVVDFLVHEAGVPLRVVDDMGRSPLCDAFWTSEPNFELLDLILKECPDLLYVKDKRGHSPLAYARRNHWNKWNKYLKDLPRRMIEPQILVSQPKQ